jgi:hypothetical protein
MLEACIDRSQCCRQVVEDLLRLSMEVVDPNHHPGGVEGDLPGNIDRSAAACLDDMGVAKRLRQ